MPPSVLAHAGAVLPLTERPPTVQSTPFEHEIASTDQELAGMVIGLHVVPPSVVLIPKAAVCASVAPSGLAPIATQSVAEEHDTERSIPVPPLTNCADQVCPPSSLTRICAPTATQNVELGQSTDPRAPTSFGRVGTLQVAPPSDEISSWPP